MRLWLKRCSVARLRFGAAFIVLAAFERFVSTLKPWSRHPVLGELRHVNIGGLWVARTGVFLVAALLALTGWRERLYAAILVPLIGFSELHAHGAWCCNSPRNERWLCNEMQEAARALDAHGVRWTLTDGDLLGAVRRGERVPWEKDLDVCFHPADCQEACNAFPGEGCSAWCTVTAPLCTDGDQRCVGRRTNLIVREMEHAHVGEIKFDLAICPYYTNLTAWTHPSAGGTASLCGREYRIEPAWAQSLRFQYGDDWNVESVSPYPTATKGGVWLFPHQRACQDTARLTSCRVNNWNRELGCAILLDRGIFFPDTQLQWTVYRAFQTVLLAPVAAWLWRGIRRPYIRPGVNVAKTVGLSVLVQV